MDRYLAGNIPQDCHPKIRALTEYWLSIHPPHGLPGRQHFDPSHIPSLLANLYLVDVAGPDNVFTFRLMGTALVELFGRDYTGRPFESAYDSGRNSNSYRDMGEIVADRQPRWRRAPAYFTQNRDHLILERVVLPLAHDGRTVDIFLGMIVAETQSGDPVA